MFFRIRYHMSFGPRASKTGDPAADNGCHPREKTMDMEKNRAMGRVITRLINKENLSLQESHASCRRSVSVLL